MQHGIKTLPVRMRQICASSQRITEFLATHAAMAGALTGTARPSEPPAGRQANAGWFRWRGIAGVAWRRRHRRPGGGCERARVFTLAVSLGSVESLIEHPARMTHCTTAGIPVGVSDSLTAPVDRPRRLRRVDRRPRACPGLREPSTTGEVRVSRRRRPLGDSNDSSAGKRQRAAVRLGF